MKYFLIQSVANGGQTFFSRITEQYGPDYTNKPSCLSQHYITVNGDIKQSGKTKKNIESRIH